MDFDSSEVQEMLRKDARRLLTEKCPKSYVRKMEELQDYSMDFDPEMKFEDFSKEFIIKLLHEYARSYILIDGLWSTEITQKHGDAVARDCDLAVWLRIEEIIYPRIAKILNIQVKDVLDVLKTWQLAPDGYKQDYYDIELDVKNSNHVIWTTKRCGMLSYFERKAPEKIASVCHDMEQPIMQKIFGIFNPDMRVKLLKLPPRKSPDEIACQFEFKLEV